MVYFKVPVSISLLCLAILTEVSCFESDVFRLLLPLITRPELSFFSSPVYLSLGTLVGGLVPIAIVLEVLWIIFMIIWYLTGLPIGPGTPTALPAGIL